MNYVVKRGDTVAGIARAHNIPLNEFIAAATVTTQVKYIVVFGRKLRLPRRFQPGGIFCPGQEITIPQRTNEQ